MYRISQSLPALIGLLLIFASLIATRPLPPKSPVTPPKLDQGHAAQVARLVDAQAAIGGDIQGSVAARRGLTEQSFSASALSYSQMQLEQEIDAYTPPSEAVYAPPWVYEAGPTMYGDLVAQTERLDLYVSPHTFSAEQVAAVAPQIEQALREAELTFGETLDYRVAMGFYTPAASPIRGARGLAYTEERRAQLFYLPHEDLDRAITVAAHELGHQLQVRRYGDEVQRRVDTILHEGLATWMVGGRWLAMQESHDWKAHTRKLCANGIPPRLLDAERYGANNAYELWASFVDFLVERYGMETLDALYRSGTGRAPGSADYSGITGKTLDELADEWRAWFEEG